MTPEAFLGELAPMVTVLFERHEAHARQWSTHQFFERLRDEAEPRRPLERHDPLFSALWVNVLTEDNLPHYFHTASSLIEASAPWKRWIDTWLAEESQHAIALRDLLLFRGWLPSAPIEAARLAQLATGWSSPFITSPLQLVVYAALQELATRVSHSNTRRLMDDEAGRAVLGHISADENRHFLFYRDLVAEALARWRSEVVVELDHQIRNFRMPGRAMDGFEDHSRHIAAAHIYDVEIHVDRILRPLLHHWQIEELDGLDPAAEAARSRLSRFVDRLARAGQALGRKHHAPQPLVAAEGGRS